MEETCKGSKLAGLNFEVESLQTEDKDLELQCHSEKFTLNLDET